METSRLVVDDAVRRLAVLAEWLSAAFDYNVAPFFQSFVEVDGRTIDATAFAWFPTVFTDV